MLLALAALIGTSCAKAAPVETPKPPPPPPVIVPTASPPEHLDIQGRSAPIGAGKQSVMIFINGHRVIDGTLSPSAPQNRFHGSYEGHDVVAECALRKKVDCAITIDGAPTSSH